MFFKIVSYLTAFLVIFSPLLNGAHASQKENFMYCVGFSATVPQRPMIVDLNNEKVFYSEIALSSSERHEIFFDPDAKKIIFIRIKSSKYVEIFLVNINAKILSEPIYTTKSGSKFSFSRAAWSQDTKTLCLTGKIHDKNSGQRKLTLMCLKFDGVKVISKAFNLSDKMYAHTGIWTISNQLIVTGRKTKAAHDIGEKENVYLFFNLNDWSFNVDTDVEKRKLIIIGQFDKDSLAMTDLSSIYQLTKKNIKRVGDYREGLSRIYGMPMGKTDYYSQIYIVKEEEDLQYEKRILALTPLCKTKKYHVLFDSKTIGRLSDSVFSNESLKLNFTDKILDIE